MFAARQNDVRATVVGVINPIRYCTYDHGVGDFPIGNKSEDRVEGTGFPIPCADKDMPVATIAPVGIRLDCPTEFCRWIEGNEGILSSKRGVGVRCFRRNEQKWATFRRKFIEDRVVSIKDDLIFRLVLRVTFRFGQRVETNPSRSIDLAQQVWNRGALRVGCLPVGFEVHVVSGVFVDLGVERATATRSEFHWLGKRSPQWFLHDATALRS